MKKILTFIFICITLTTFVQTSFAQSLKNEQALINIKKIVFQDERELFTVIKNLEKDEKSIAYEIFHEYKETFSLLEQFDGYLYLFSMIEKHKKANAKQFMKIFKEDFITRTNISLEYLVVQQSFTKLPVVNDYAEKLKKRIKDSQDIVSTFEF